MTKFSAEEIKKTANLARLQFSEQEIPDYEQKLTGVLRFAEKINEVDTTDIAPLAHPLELQQPLRPDQVTETDQRQAFQAIAPNVEAGLYLVPQVIE